MANILNKAIKNGGNLKAIFSQYYRNTKYKSMKQQKYNNSDLYYCAIMTKISRADKAKLIKIADGFNMTLYQLFQSLLLAIVRYFDSESIVTSEHNIMMNAFADTIFSIKDSYSPLSIRGHQKQRVRKAILFVERPKKKPQLLSVSKDSCGNLMESYNFETMLSDFLGALDPEALKVLTQLKEKWGYFSLIHTLHKTILQRKPAPADTIKEEIQQLFADERIATGDRLNEDVHYKRKRNNGEDYTTPTIHKKNVRVSLMKI